jgi:hypothetical protein
MSIVEMQTKAKNKNNIPLYLIKRTPRTRMVDWMYTTIILDIALDSGDWSA